MAANLAAALAAEGHRVALLDTDPQQSLVRWHAERVKQGRSPPPHLRQPLRLARPRGAGQAAAGSGLRHRRHPAACRIRGQAGHPRRRPGADADAALAGRFLGQRGDRQASPGRAPPGHGGAQPRPRPGQDEGQHPGRTWPARRAGAGREPRQPRPIRQRLPRWPGRHRSLPEKPRRGRDAGACRRHRRTGH
ncbi:hypothetical protein ACFQY5_24045 [Paeniroseomonas aquatica]|uniref:nucleotide-binding protein n=1 Tax=Paeniroseomonas aquatica TaxID=373043 RepID=UPI00360EC6CA